MWGFAVREFLDERHCFMARKKKPSVNKTQAIKETMDKFPSLGPQAIAAKLKEQGVSVTPAYVSTIKSSLKRRAQKATGVRNGASGGFIAISALKQAQDFIEKAGGVDQAREALDVLAKLK